MSNTDPKGARINRPPGLDLVREYADIRREGYFPEMTEEQAIEAFEQLHQTQPNEEIKP